MVYKLDKADQRCDVTYIDWSKKYSPIPKATCDMIQPKCSSGGGGSDNTPELSCEDIKKLLKGEDKPKEEEKPKEDKTEGEKPKEDTPREETPSDNVGGNPAEDKEKPTTEEVTPKENEPAPSPRVEEQPAEPTPEPPVADTPREETPNEEGKEVNLLELMPRVEDKFSQVVYTPEHTVSTVIHNNPEEKLAFENKIIKILKSKLPEKATVEAVLGEPYYKEGMKRNEGKDNYTLYIRVTFKGKIYEQVYNVPHVEEFTATGVDHF